MPTTAKVTRFIFTRRAKNMFRNISANYMLSNEALERSSIVANNLMNRERVCTGKNSYTKDLNFNILDFLRSRLASGDRVNWLDLCCGRGRALIEAAETLATEALPDPLDITGLDLISHFDPYAAPLHFLKMVESSVFQWQPARTYDLITCVHGLHYLGDKLGAITNACSWLKPNGVFVANLDLNNIKGTDGKPLTRTLLKRFRSAGLDWQPTRHIIRSDARRELNLGYRYLGADDKAGPNYTGQPAVDSYYA